MKILRRRARIADLQVVLSAQRQEALEPGAGVFGALAFVTVGEQQYEIARLTPLCFGAGNEIVNDDLGCVGEVSELGFPENKCERIRAAVAKLKTENCRFRE